jgi:hypothetical protein
LWTGGATRDTGFARELWEQNGRPEGRDLEFWTKAEAEVNAPAVVAGYAVEAMAC